MAIHEFEGSWYAIHNLTIKKNARAGYDVALVCSGAACYLFCITRRAPLSRERLSQIVDERLLQELSRDPIYRIHRNDCELVSVRSQYFHTAPVFQDLEIKPPACVQVFSITIQDGAYRLNYPSDPVQCKAQLSYVPLDYTVELRQTNRRKKRCELSVKLGSNEGYTDGAICYRVGGLAPIPIPAQWIGRPIPLFTPNMEEITVEVDEEFLGQYCCVEKKEI